MNHEIKESKPKTISLNAVLRQAQVKDKATRRALELPEAEKVTTKPNRKVKDKKGNKARKEQQALIRARKRQEMHMQLLSKGWDRQKRLEVALEALQGILEVRAKNIEKHAENLKASEDILAARKLHAEEGRKLLEEQSKQQDSLDQ